MLLQAIKVSVILLLASVPHHVALGKDPKDVKRPLVQLEQGYLLGEVWKSFEEKDFYAFKAIPFAEPPIGRLRFKAPVRHTKWDGVWDSAGQADRMCAQMTFYETLEGIEDCLYLNVYSSRLPKDGEPDLNLPVLFYIHGGGFFAGSGGPNIYGPDYFMDDSQDVVMVFPNYRLGPLGFWTLQTDDAPGNLALRDQIMALEWTRDNIAKFGGDPNKVLLYGESAGGMSVMYLMTSPLAQGLFHCAISMSGPTISSYTHWDKEPRIYYRRFAKEFGCDQNTTEEIIQCMQTIPPLDLAAKLQFFLQFKWTGPNVWMPYTDAKWQDNPIIPLAPEEALRSGNFARVPTIFTSNSNEGAFNLVGYLKGLISFEEVSERWDELAPLILFHRSIDERSELDIKLANQLKKFYFNDHKIQNYDFNTIDRFAKMYGDHMFYSGIDRTIGYMLDFKDHSPIYYMINSYQGPLSVIDVFVLNPFLHIFKTTLKYLWNIDIWDNGLGVAHADGLSILFRPHIMGIPSLFSERDKIVSKRLIKIIINFAKSGNPNSEGLPWNWESIIDKQSKAYLNITANDDWKMATDEDRIKRNNMWKIVLDTLSENSRELSTNPAFTEQEILEKLRKKSDYQTKTEL